MNNEQHKKLSAATITINLAAIVGSGYVGFKHGSGLSMEPEFLDYSPLVFPAVNFLFSAIQGVAELEKKGIDPLDNIAGLVNREISDEEIVNEAVPSLSSFLSTSLITGVSYGAGYALGYFTK